MISGHIRKTAIVLGGTVPHIELIRQLKARSYYVVLADFLPNPPARAHADEHVQISTLDKDDVLRLAVERKASLVISTCIDQANATACYVAEKLGLSRPYSYATAINVTNKAIMKRIMAENGIPTAKHVILGEEVSASIDSLRYPLIVKPVDSNSSKGISRVNGINMLNKAIDLARSASRSGDVIVEEYVDGIEVGVDFVVREGDAAITSSRERVKVNPLTSDEQQIIGSYWPSDTVKYNKKQFLSIGAKIAQVFGLDNTPFFMQAIVNEVDVFVLEFAARIGGGDNYRVVRNLFKYDLIESGINSYLGDPVSLDVYEPTDYYHDCYLYAKPGVIRDLIGLDRLVSEGIIEYYTVYKKVPSTISPILSSNNRVGTFTISSCRREELTQKRKQALDNLRIDDEHGNDILYRELYEGVAK